MAMIKHVDKKVQATNNDEITAGLFLDLSKAFDTKGMTFFWIKWPIMESDVWPWNGSKIT